MIAILIGILLSFFANLVPDFVVTHEPLLQGLIRMATRLT